LQHKATKTKIILMSMRPTTYKISLSKNVLISEVLDLKCFMKHKTGL
jgi:hypothetical protein